MSGADRAELVTCALFCYNQREFVGQAIDSLLSQDYSPLEVILSDDASTDGTADVIREAAVRYRGPHKVVVNVNPRNLGLTPHVNLVTGMATGRLIVAAAGDDVSLPHRTRTLHKAWVAAGRGAHALYSRCIVTDRMGTDKRIGLPRAHDRYNDRRHMAALGGWILGATSAWTRDLFEFFGPLAPGLMVEDHAIPFRAAMLDGIVLVDEPLVRYREGVSQWWNMRHDRSMGGERRRQRFQHYCAIESSNAEQASRDLAVLGDAFLRELGRRRCIRAEAMRQLAACGPWSFGEAWRAWKAGVNLSRIGAWQLQTHVPYGAWLIDALGACTRLISRSA